MLFFVVYSFDILGLKKDKNIASDRELVSIDNVMDKKKQRYIASKNATSSREKNQQTNKTAIKKEYLFIEDAFSNKVVVLDMFGNKIKDIYVGKNPHDIAVSPDNKYVAVANFGDGTVSLIDTTEMQVKKNIYTGEGTHGVVFDRKSKFLFVANSISGTLTVLSLDRFPDEINRKDIIIGKYPEYVGITVDNKYIFTTNLSGSGSVTIISNNGLNSKIYKTLKLGIDPHGWAVSPDGKKIIITNLGSSTTYMLSSKDFSVIAEIDTGTATELASFKNNQELWTTEINSEFLNIIDVDRKSIVDKIRVGNMPHGVFFSKDKEIAFVPLYESGDLVIIDTKNKNIKKKVNIGKHLHNAVVVSIIE